MVMRYKIMSDAGINISENLATIQCRINNAVKSRSSTLPPKKTILVAVSKTKPLVSIKKAYDAGQRHFGENYLKELIVKSTNPDIALLCPDIKWHFIGMFQTKMASTLMRVRNLHMLETLSSQSHADAVNSRWKEEDPLNVLVQVNSSGEETKSGINPIACIDLARHIRDNCPRLHFRGLMTIGKPGHDYSSGTNPDFDLLLECRDRVCRELSLEASDVDLSMGMSADFEEAIKAGSSMVRVGSSIFGARDYSPKDK